MSISMYSASVPVFIRMLNNLAGVLEKGDAYAKTKNIDASVLLGSRLFPDMFPLAKQVHIATDGCKGGVARLAGVDIPVYEDNEKTFAELAARCRKTVAFLESIKASQIDGTEDKAITLETKAGPLHFKGQNYLLNHVNPNFFFHVATAYGILRHNGVELGKRDYLGKP
jgi:hypothetical protein